MNIITISLWETLLRMVVLGSKRAPRVSHFILLWTIVLNISVLGTNHSIECPHFERKEPNVFGTACLLDSNQQPKMDFYFIFGHFSKHFWRPLTMCKAFYRDYSGKDSVVAFQMRWGWSQTA